jgi:hypothetical protein
MRCVTSKEEQDGATHRHTLLGKSVHRRKPWLQARKGSTFLPEPRRNIDGYLILIPVHLLGEGRRGRKHPRQLPLGLCRRIDVVCKVRSGHG